MLCAVILLALLAIGAPAVAQQLEPPFNASYVLADLGPVPGVPTSYGGLTFLLGDPNTIIIGGYANNSSGRLYSVRVVRGPDNRITGFSGSASKFIAAPFNDAGVVYGPNDVLFLSRHPVSQMGQTLPWSRVPDKVVDLQPLIELALDEAGIAVNRTPSGGGLMFVPPGFFNAGNLKMVTFPEGYWFELGYAPDGMETFDITGATYVLQLPGGPQGFVYVPPGSPKFQDFTSMLVADWFDSRISAYAVDLNGDPIVETRTAFVTGLPGPEGATVDPLTGDFLFSVFGASPDGTADGVVAVRGFAVPCGNGIIEPGEQCDDGNTNDGDCCSSACQFAPPTTACRPAAGVCDVTEHCTGSSGVCPADTKHTTACRPASGTCDVAESCDGVRDDCPPDTLAAAGTTCRAAAGVCDVAETCSGNSPACPADIFAPVGTTCRAAAGPCDATETCSGTGPTCPADAVAPSGTACRAAAGPCDTAETCSGDSVTCPADGFAPAATVCRAAASVCDVAETCSGNSPTCPADAVAPRGTECRAAAGPCDVPETCSGTAPECPADAKSSAACREATGACDVAEHCDGMHDDCPPDLFASADTPCRPAAGPCDKAELCTGVSVSCPLDEFATAGVVCRAAAGPCDVSEFCSGWGSGCSRDWKSWDVCRPAVNACDVAEWCDGARIDCPPDVLAPDGTACDDGDSCTTGDACVAGTCTGQSRCEP